MEISLDSILQAHKYRSMFNDRFFNKLDAVIVCADDEYSSLFVDNRAVRAGKVRGATYRCGEEQHVSVSETHIGFH